MTYSRLAFGGSSLWLMSWCQTTSELPRLPIALPSTTILEMTATYGGVTTIRSPGAMSSSPNRREKVTKALSSSC